MHDTQVETVATRKHVRRGLGGVLAALLLITTGTTEAKDTEAPAVLGPAPSWERFRVLAELHVKALLVDPQSAQFTWSLGYRGGVWKPFLQRRVNGYIGCGYVNSRNRMGGYVGATSFVVVIDNDRVIFAEIGNANAADLVSASCAQATSNGYFPPISDVAGAGAQAAGGQPGHGFVVTTVPDGAYVASVVAGSPAAQAGLRPGMVVSHLNGVALNGLAAETVTQMMDRTDGPVALGIVGGTVLNIARIPAPRRSPADGSRTDAVPTEARCQRR